MKAIRLTGVVTLAALLAGCAGTKNVSLDTGATTPPPAKSAEAAPETPAPVAPTRNATDLPERVVALPRAAPVPQPRNESPVETVLSPIYEKPVETVAVPQPRYEPVQTVTVPEPVVEDAPETAQYTPVGDLDAPAPVAIAALPAAPQPVYEMRVEVLDATPGPLGRTMAPIRDDPADAGNDRRAMNSEIRQHARKGYRRHAALRAGGLKPKVRSNFTPAFGAKLEQAALGRLNPGVRYDARYVPIGYPWGDVDEATGVCTDVVIRSYRKLGIDLQEMVHEDMKRAFRAYPSKRIYGLKKADPNIDHRRVVNLEAFFERTGASIPIGTVPEDFAPGDVLTWRLSGNEPHIGIVIGDRDPRTGMPLVVHNLGAGVRKEDLITLSSPVGHFRFAPDRQTVVAALVTKR